MTKEAKRRQAPERTRPRRLGQEALHSATPRDARHCGAFISVGLSQRTARSCEGTNQGDCSPCSDWFALGALWRKHQPDVDEFEGVLMAWEPLA
jgi:hypothetical protein